MTTPEDTTTATDESVITDLDPLYNPDHERAKTDLVRFTRFINNGGKIELSAEQRAPLQDDRGFAELEHFMQGALFMLQRLLKDQAFMVPSAARFVQNQAVSASLALVALYHASSPGFVEYYDRLASAPAVTENAGVDETLPQLS